MTGKTSDRNRHVGVSDLYLRFGGRPLHDRVVPVANDEEAEKIGAKIYEKTLQSDLFKLTGKLDGQA